MKVLTVTGTARERGQTIGEELRKSIHCMIEKHDQTITKRGYSVEAYKTAFNQYHRYLDAVTKWTPDLLEEVWGLAEGAGISRETAFQLQLVDEDWSFDAYHFAPRAKIANKCTSFGMVGENGIPTYAGQNMDIPSYVDGHQVLLRIQYPESDLESLVYTFAGSIVLCGMNNSPLGVNCNTLMQLGGCADGLPVAFVARTILEQTTYSDAIAFLNTIKHAAGQNYILSTIDKVGSFECSPNQVVEYCPRVDGSRVCHTNHPLANEDVDNFRELIKTASHNGWVRGYCDTSSRFASIAARTMNRTGSVELDELKAALSAKDDVDHPVCRDHSTDINASAIAFTAGSLIYEMTENPKLHLAAGPPSESEFMTFEFT